MNATVQRKGSAREQGREPANKAKQMSGKTNPPRYSSLCFYRRRVRDAIPYHSTPYHSTPYHSVSHHAIVSCQPTSIPLTSTMISKRFRPANKTAPASSPRASTISFRLDVYVDVAPSSARGSPTTCGDKARQGKARSDQIRSDRIKSSPSTRNAKSTRHAKSMHET